MGERRAASAPRTILNSINLKTRRLREGGAGQRRASSRAADVGARWWWWYSHSARDSAHGFVAERQNATPVPAERRIDFLVAAPLASGESSRDEDAGSDALQQEERADGALQLPAARLHAAVPEPVGQAAEEEQRIEHKLEDHADALKRARRHRASAAAAREWMRLLLCFLRPGSDALPRARRATSGEVPGGGEIRPRDRQVIVPAKTSNPPRIPLRTQAPNDDALTCSIHALLTPPAREGALRPALGEAHAGLTSILFGGQESSETVLHPAPPAAPAPPAHEEAAAAIPRLPVQRYNLLSPHHATKKRQNKLERCSLRAHCVVTAS